MVIVDEKKRARYFVSLFFLQLFERFSFFGFFYILIFFCINKLSLTESQASIFAGSFTALCYVLSSLGGYVADKVLGVRRALFTGGICLLLGYSILASGDLFTDAAVYFGLAMVITGACMFVPMTLNSVSRLYAGDPAKLDSIYAYFNMANNIGALSGAILIPYLSSADSYGLENRHYGLALGVCAFGVLLALLNVFLNKQLFLSIAAPIGKKALGFKKLVTVIFGVMIFISLIATLLYFNRVISLVLVAAVIVIVGYFIYMTFQQDKEYRLKMLLLLVFIFYATIFFMTYAQKTTSFFLFNVHHVDLNVLGMRLNSQTVPGLLNTSGILIFSPLLAMYFNKMGDRLRSTSKFALCLMFAGLCYGFLFLVCLFNDPTSKVSFWWEVFAVGVFFSWAEIMATAVGLSLITQLVPTRVRGFCMGMWFLTWAVGIKMGAFIASLFASSNLESSKSSKLLGQAKIDSYLGYQELFMWIMIVTLVAAFSLFIIKRWINRVIYNN
ncbi:peptide MFS transporter [Francisella frigiditurris]|uniref:peptide MFS transporter n=1 Tax=Francisella frigiditurris TaxID=1542390 RepID=UPI0012EB3756|nr:peptide MFS transporter [Francisella frigiditurris]